ncbi:hypothetical protein B0G81_6772 [Paraburkholderia sp. BL6665CI2N2]|uniref:hypothetical protein n=1 Tax=Paraburkholderia sp. BL6665CI2N2 TaxID=1938806 RepID=UPI001065DF12|nr:hypothetical protein [Paraburkholderia sp. BL6665CI2N2]TDY26262.1 hypothetical protein B0G81_6772 [Paraburkholderia sp. BL6665CI2N2]
MTTKDTGSVSEELIKQLRRNERMSLTPWARHDFKMAADLIEQQEAARIRELEAAASAQATVGAVAWMLRIGDSDVWTYTRLESDADFYGKQSGLKYEKRPLYAAPTASDAWQPIETAPKDGTNILIRFGLDGVSQAKFTPGWAWPWQFIDTNDGVTWMLNRAVDGPGGPSHWMPLPAAPAALFQQKEAS